MQNTPFQKSSFIYQISNSTDNLTNSFPDFLSIGQYYFPIRDKEIEA